MTADLLAAARWECAAAAPGSVDSPAHLDRADGLDWIPAIVPGTGAAAVRAASGVEAARSIDFDGFDWWFRTVVECDAPSAARLRSEGLATLAEIWWDGRLLAQSDAMFTPVEAVVDLTPGAHAIAIRFRALGPVLAEKHPRPRWRSQLVATQSLRWIRTSLLGRMPALAPFFAPVGPWRPVTLIPTDQLPFEVADLDVTIDGDAGQVAVRLATASPAAVLRVAGVDSAFVTTPEGTSATVRVPNVERWWPHTHGDQPLYDVRVVVGTRDEVVARVGFRDLTADRSNGGFALLVNGERLFVRGACWVPVDPTGLLDDVPKMREQLLALRAAGMNMVRVTGTYVYESASFWDACDELGLLVWQDAMLATLDPPEDEGWLQALATEVTAVLKPLRGRPSLAVVSGGTETEQQPTMLGLPADRLTMTALSTTVPSVVERIVPGTPYVSSTPSGGDLPTHNGSGLAHYFGVGGYRRPLTDIRRTGVRFAAECLAFATPPERPSVRELFDTDDPLADPRWSAGVPSDHGVDWTFGDVTDHYVHDLVDASVIDAAEPALLLDLRRAVVAHVMVEAFSEWRRPQSGCGGALVLAARDLEPGPGWGLADVLGQPKAPLLALGTVLAPRALLITDEGLDGLALHLANDTDTDVAGSLEVTLLGRAGGREYATADLVVRARSVASRSLDGVIGSFRDVLNAYGFGPPQYEGVLVVWRNDSGAEVARRYRTIGQWPIGDPGLTASMTRGGGAWTVTVTSARAAVGVVVEAPGWTADGGWFEIEPGGSRDVVLVTNGSGPMPDAVVRALGGPDVAVVESR